MAELKTKKNDDDVHAFLDTVEDEVKRGDCYELLELMARLTGQPGRMWGKSIVGFGEYSYKTADGKEHEWFRTGFSPRKQNLTLYVMTGFDDYDLSRLGKHSTGVSCLYVKKLDDIDRGVLEDLIVASLDRFDLRTADTGLIK